MIERVHEHIVAEMQQSAKTDSVFVITAVAFNLIVLGINWAVAESATSRNGSVAAEFTFPILVAATVAINIFTVRALRAGKKTRRTLIEGLLAMYRDSGVEKYYDATLVDTYSSRYDLFSYVIMCLAAVAIVVPMFERLLGT
jgi:hypothetical protein